MEKEKPGHKEGDPVLKDDNLIAVEAVKGDNINKEIVHNTFKLDKEIQLVDNKIDTGNKPFYTIEIATTILTDIATNPNNTIEEICRENGTTIQELHKWRLFNDTFNEAYFRAQELRQDSTVENLDNLLAKLEEYIEEKVDPREKHVRIQFFHRLMQHTHWRASKLNRRYQDKSELSVTVDAAQRRSAAWQQHHKEIDTK